MTDLTLKELKENPLISSVSEHCAWYGVVGAVIDHQVAANKADSGYYIVAGLGQFPEYKTPKDIQDDQERNIQLFHPKQFAMKLSRDNIQFAIEELYNYCQAAEMLDCLYREYECKVPDVIRFSELNELYRLNKEWNDKSKDVFWRRSCKEQLDSFFKDEKRAEKNKLVRNRIDYNRSDNLDHTKSRTENILSSLKKRDQIIPLAILKRCSPNLSTAELKEDEFQQLKEVLKKYPKITYSIDDKEVIDTGEIITKDKRDNPCYGEPTHFEFREITFKKVDEPIIMGQVYKIRWGKYATERAALHGEVCSRNVSYNNIKKFINMAASSNLKFAIDTKGEFLEPDTNFVPVLFKRDQLYKYNAIFERINSDKVQSHSIKEGNLPYLSEAIDLATQKVQFVEAQEPNKSQEPEL